MKRTKHHLLFPLTLLGATLLVLAPQARAADGNSPSGSEDPALESVDADLPEVPLTHYFPTPKKHKGVWDIGFRHLATFAFEPPLDPALQRNGEQKRIPQELRSLDGTMVRIRGFMMPVEMNDAGRATECIVIPNTMSCCYGQTPRPNEWVLVTIAQPGAAILEDVPLYFYGRLHVGEIYEDGMFAGLYRLECDKVTLAE